MAITRPRTKDKSVDGQVGVFIVRIWREPQSSSGFRARIVQTFDVSEPTEILSAAETADGVCDSVRRWIEDFVVGPGT